MSSREAIFSALRRSLGVTGDEAPRRDIVAQRMANAPSGIIPARGGGDAAKRLDTFRAEATRVQATIADVASAEDVPAEIARYLSANNLPASLRIGDDPAFAPMDFGATSLEIARGASDGHDPNAASVAFAGIAETGTLALASGPFNPTTLNFLPDNHIVVLFADRMVGDMEGAFAKLRAATGKGVMPRTLNFVTGPSRSADIEQTLLLGAHGPRRLHILVVGAPF